MPLNKAQLARQARARLAKAFGGRLRGVVLYGSTARGDDEPESDIDMLVLLSPPIRLSRDLRTAIHALYPLILEEGRTIDILPVDAAAFDAQEFSLYRNAKAEGIRV